MTVTIKFRRGTTAEWEAENPILEPGEPGYESTTGFLKIGDGATAWSDLDYLNNDDLEMVSHPEVFTALLRFEDNEMVVSNGQFVFDSFPFNAGATINLHYPDSDPVNGFYRNSEADTTLFTFMDDEFQPYRVENIGKLVSVLAVPSATNPPLLYKIFTQDGVAIYDIPSTVVIEEIEGLIQDSETATNETIDIVKNDLENVEYNSLSGAVEMTAFLAHSLANPHTGKYAKVGISGELNNTWIGSFIHTNGSLGEFTNGIDIRALIRPVDYGAKVYTDEDNRSWAEIFTQTNDGSGNYDRVELAILWINGTPYLFFEWIQFGEVQEWSREPGFNIEVAGPHALSPNTSQLTSAGVIPGVWQRFRVYLWFENGNGNGEVVFQVESNNLWDTKTSDGKKWRTLLYYEMPEAASLCVNPAYPPIIGHNGEGRNDIAEVEVFELNGAQRLGFYAANATNATTVPDSIHDDDWTATNQAVIITP